MRYIPAMFCCSAVALLGAIRVSAHHSFAAEFDRTKPVELEGTISKLEWQNPHTRLYLDVKDSSGAVLSWELELSSPNTLMRAGWNRNSVHVGDVISVKGFLAKDGSRLANANTITADGKLILSEMTRPQES